MIKLSSFILFLILHQALTFGQSNSINRKLFFDDDNVIEVTLTTDIKELRNNKAKPVFQPAVIVMKFNDTSIISEQIAVQQRGIFRKKFCDMASLRLNFKTPSSPKLSRLKKLKLVGGCTIGSYNEEFLLKEYLVYKIYNQLSVMSFKVRLMHITYIDSKKKMKTYTQYAFVIEDISDVAERNNCIEKKTGCATEATNRQQITFVSLFQYMIGNTDWAVPNGHNIKLIVSKNDTLSKPYPVPYDFDYVGLVDAPYAIAQEELGLTSVRERSYRGFKRSFDELQPLIQVYKERKEVVLFTITNFTLLSKKIKNAMVFYLNEFYEIIENSRLARKIFSEDARTF